jgi:dUTP pyrophosphatase
LLRDGFYRAIKKETSRLTIEVGVKFKMIHPLARIPQYSKPGDAGADLYAVEDGELYPCQTKVISVGFAVAIPDGYELQIRPRSSLAGKGLLIPNSPGTIDAGYRGVVKVLLHNASPETIWVRAGHRIAQAVLAPVVHAEYVEVDELPESVRGTGGFGSTGV